MIKHKLFLFLSLIFICVYNPSYAVNNPAAVINSNGEIVVSNNGGGIFEPDEYYVTIYKISLSNVAPIAPTASVPFNDSKSVTIFENPEGWRMRVINGVPTSPKGVTFPPFGTYSYAHIELAPEIEIMAHAKFDQPIKLSYDSAIPAQPAGTYFWSKTGDRWVYEDRNNDRNIRVGYGQTWNKEESGITKLNINTFDENGSSYIANTTTSMGNTTGYLVSSNKTLGSGNGIGIMGTVDKMIVLMQFSTPLNIAKDSALEVSFDVSQSVSVNCHRSNSSSPYTIWSFTPQFFNIRITSK